MKQILILTGLFVLITVIASAQNGITIETFPDPLTIECNDSSEGYDIQLVNVWIDDYIANAMVTNECNDPGITWSHDYSGQTITDCSSYLDIQFTVTNACGESDESFGTIGVEDFEGPPLGPPTYSEFTLLCDGSGDVVGLQELIDNDFYFTIEDDFCQGGPVELMHDPFNFQCDQTDYISFYTEDECGNQSDLHTIEFNIIALNVDFIALDYPVLEDGNQVDVCLKLSNESPVDVTAEVSYIAQTATSGLDYTSIPATQNLTFPANSLAEQCFSVTILEDNLIEANETIGFEITDVSSTYLAGIGADYETHITILDNDDYDNDNVENSVDNCPNSFNPFQEDFDNDGSGDVCDDNTTISEISEFQDYIYINRLYSGVIVKSLNGQCWVMVVQNDGTLNTVSVTCPSN